MLTALSGFGFAIALALLVLLFARPQRLTGDVWLYVWTGANLALFAGMVLARLDHAGLAIAGSFTVQIAVSLLAPALYLFTWSLTKGRTPVRKLALAGLPVVVTAIFLTVLAFIPMQVSSGRILVQVPALWLALLPLAAIAGNALFPLAALRRIHDHRKALGRAPTQTIRSDLDWVRAWIASHLILLGVLLISFMLTFTGWLDADLQLGTVLVAQGSLLGYVGFRGITRSHVFFAADEAVWRAARLGTQRQRAEADFEAIKQRLAEREIHTQPGLNSQQFAAQMGWGMDRINEAIRAGGNTSFSQLVTQARLSTFKAWARDRAHARINSLTLALDAGFGSKSAFHDAFKAQEGITPGEWRRRHQR